MAPLLHNMEYLGAYSAVMSVCVKRWTWWHIMFLIPWKISWLCIPLYLSCFSDQFHLTLKVQSLKVLPPSRKVCLFSLQILSHKVVHLDCSKVHLIKAISNTKKQLHWERHRANQMFKWMLLFKFQCFAFIEDLGNQINSAVFNHNCCS